MLQSMVVAKSQTRLGDRETTRPQCFEPEWSIIHRARVVVDSMAAFGLLDLICMRYGYMWMTDKK